MRTVEASEHFRERRRLIDENGVVHLGVIHAPSHILCDHMYEKIRRVQFVPFQHPTCLWCVELLVKVVR